MEFEAEEMRVEYNLEVVEEMEDEEEVEVGGDKPKFVLLEFCQLENLLQRCPECGRLPGGRKAGKPKRVDGKISDGWKKEIVEESLERKRREGRRVPMELVQDEYLDVVRDQLEQILVFSDSEEEDSE